MKKIRVAVATDDGKNLMGRHFGDAAFYEVFDLFSDRSDAVSRIENDTDEENGHADPVKAKGVASLLKPQGVQVLVAKVFGPNLKRIRRHFVCVLTHLDDVDASLEQLREHRDAIEEAWDLGEERRHLDLRRK